MGVTVATESLAGADVAMTVGVELIIDVEVSDIGVDKRAVDASLL